MEIKRTIFDINDYVYYYHHYQDYSWIYHGLTNHYNRIILKQIGYRYQNQKKGFWTTNYKI